MSYRLTAADRGLIVTALRALGGTDADALADRMVAAASPAASKPPRRRRIPVLPKRSTLAREAAAWDQRATLARGSERVRRENTETLRELIALHSGQPSPSGFSS